MLFASMYCVATLGRNPQMPQQSTVSNAGTSQPDIESILLLATNRKGFTQIFTDAIISARSGGKNQRFDFQNLNGYIVDNMNRGLIKFLAHDKNGFLEDGTYTFTVEYWTDEIRKKNRILKTDSKLIEEYLAYKNKIVYSHERKPSRVS